MREIIKKPNKELNPKGYGGFFRFFEAMEAEGLWSGIHKALEKRRLEEIEQGGKLSGGDDREQFKYIPGRGLVKRD
jgi:hypothetical protein